MLAEFLRVIYNIQFLFTVMLPEMSAIVNGKCFWCILVCMIM